MRQEKRTEKVRTFDRVEENLSPDRFCPIREDDVHCPDERACSAAKIAAAYPAVLAPIIARSTGCHRYNMRASCATLACQAECVPLLARITHEDFYYNANTPLRQAWPWIPHGQAGGLAPHDLNVLFQVRLGLSGLHAPVSLGVSAVSSRSFMNNVG